MEQMTLTTLEPSAEESNPESRVPETLASINPFTIQGNAFIGNISIFSKEMVVITYRINNEIITGHRKQINCLDNASPLMPLKFAALEQNLGPLVAILLWQK